MSPRTHFGNARMNAWRVDVIDGNTSRQCSFWQLLILLCLYCVLCLLRHHWHREEMVWVGNLITSAQWTENDHCECNKTARENEPRFPAVFWIRKMSGENPTCACSSITFSFCTPCRHCSYIWENYLVTFENIFVSNACRPICQLHFTEVNLSFVPKQDSIFFLLFTSMNSLKCPRCYTWNPLNSFFFK